MLRFSILPRALVALNAIRSTDTTRPILNGVHLAPDGTMTATDGHVLLTWRNAATLNEHFPNAEIPTDGLILEITPALLKLAKAKKCTALDLEITDDVARWINPQGEVTLARVLDGPYPNYRCVIPREVPDVVGAMPSLNAEYLGRFALAAGNPNANGITLTPTGPERVVCITFDNNLDAFGLIMPLRETDATTRNVPAWVHPVTTAAPETETAATSPDGYGVQPRADCPAAEHDDTNAGCTCSQRVRVA